MKKPSALIRERFNGWLVGFGVCALAGLPGCFTPALLEDPIRQGEISSIDGVYLGLDQSLTLLVELDDADQLELVGLQIDGDDIDRAVRCADSEIDGNRVAFSVKPGERIGRSIEAQLMRDENREGMTRSLIEDRVEAEGQWLALTSFQQSDGWLIRVPTHWHGAEVVFEIDARPGSYEDKSIFSDIGKVVLLPFALAADTVVVAVSIPVVMAGIAWYVTAYPGPA